MTSKAASLHNPYFHKEEGEKDIWSLINEAAHDASVNNPDRPIYNLGQGFFSYNPPDFALESVADAISKPQFNQYAPAKGNGNLLASLKQKYSKDFGYDITTDQISITTGANEGMLSVFFGFLTPGDEVIVFQPFFDQYIPNIEMTGAKVKYVEFEFPTNFSSENVTGDDWKVNFEQLEKTITDKTKLIVVNTPHNPIGKVYNEEELTKIGELAIKHNLIIVSDEVYENLYFEDKFPRFSTLKNLPELKERVLTVGSAGKSFAATGWRVGWVIGAKELIKYVIAAHTRICFSTPAPLQQAVSEAFVKAEENNYFEVTRQQYLKKYEIFTSVFDELGLPYTTAAGGYFLLVNLSKVKVPKDYSFPDSFKNKTNDFKLAYWLINEFGVVGIPPTEFLHPDARVGHGLENCIRFAVCKDDEFLKNATDRIRLLKDYL
ncbi:probable kynurenine--oxoglutarate transaminase Bna3p [[Candida] jaroonii]|uniref:Probable kynurenine--oxoglutarate transaminase Bna3p n=1 Tax=[Candida] jaroonii TaxID=467808 RepID=A0ACA9YFN5_9ASCO|nr:probable kynurenine--oxoglutarate transaminase Bna3p [[Candida] jaroonii]